LRTGKLNWFVVTTKPQQERVALENLERQGLKCFLPLAENPYQRQNRKSRPLIEPLFPNYLFLQANIHHQSLAPVRYTRGVLSLVRFGLNIAVVPDSIINLLQSQISTETGLVKLAPDKLDPGDNVCMFDGPLVGLKGILKEHCSKTRAILLLNILGSETTVEVDSLLLQKAR